MRELRALLVALAAGAVLLAGSAGGLTMVPAAQAATTDASGFFIDGGGFGHGVGMSQYGALGFALHGFSYSQILAHYYRGTTLGHVSPVQDVTVMLTNGPGAEFGGANLVRGAAAEGPKNPKQMKLKPLRAYTVVPSGNLLKVEFHSRKVISLVPPLVVDGPGPLSLAGVGSYHGELEFRRLPSGLVQTINKVDIEDYVRGVIGAEMPSRWPPQALEAQAVAARTFVLTAPPVNPAFDVYPDTRSQEYGGIRAEAPSTNAAESATRGQVVEYGGRPVITYFFSSSGGHTESVQNAFPGTSPEPWLVGVPDPYDDSDGNPYYRWNETLSLDDAAHILTGLVKGQFEGIKILQHGVSPRVVRAAVVGTEGTTDVTGPRLRELFGLRSTYVAFTTITTRSTTKKTTRPVRPQRPPSGPVSGGAGFGPGSRTHRGGGAVRLSRTLEGTAFPAGGGLIVAQRLERVGWRDAGRADVGPTGSYTLEVAHPGLYRVVYRGIDGPTVAVK